MVVVSSDHLDELFSLVEALSVSSEVPPDYSRIRELVSLMRVGLSTHVDKPPKAHVVAINGLGDLIVRELDSVDAVPDFLSQLSDDKSRRVHVFLGTRVFISRGPLKYLLVPGREPIPLFKPSEPVPDPDGLLYD